MEKITYGGWKNNLRLSNGEVELIVTLDVGPRILSYRLAGGKNVFKEYDEQLGKSGEKEWMIRGGHRLWAAPEDLTRTYFPDNGPVTCKEESDGRVHIVAPPEQEYGIQKELDIRVASSGSQVTVVHRITNVGKEKTELAPWALTVLAPGGIEIIPLPQKRPHPGSPKNAKSPRDFAPNLRMILWPFFDFKDPRCTLGSKYLTLKQDPRATGPIKFGLLHLLEWVAYLNNQTLFIKRIPGQEDKAYPDLGCNFETFTNADMLEMESLGPFVSLAAGQTVEHTETWELIGNVQGFSSEAQIDQHILPKVPRR
jgi:hypothetical protein